MTFNATSFEDKATHVQNQVSVNAQLAFKAKHGISKQPVERRHGLLARALRGNKDPGGELPTPHDSSDQ